jgi:menaquinone-specific isochorismate synthase
VNLPLPSFPNNSLSDIKQNLRNKLCQLFSSDFFLSNVSIKQVIRLEQPLSGCSPLPWLQWQTHPIKIYWSNRQLNFESAGVGLADKIKCDNGQDYNFKLAEIQNNLRDYSGKARYYGGIRFNSKANADEHWLPYGSCLFILPQFELFSDTTGTYFACNIVIEPGQLTRRKLDYMLESLDSIRVCNDAGIKSEKISSFFREDIPSKINWFVNIESVLNILKSGKIKKIVLGRSSIFYFDKALRPLQIMQRLKEIEPFAYHFFIQPQEGTAFVGATPERLYKRQGNLIESEAVAGTCARGATPEDDERLSETLLRSEKDHREHIMVRDHLKLLLQQFCRYLEVGEVKLLHQTKVQHLYSYIFGYLREKITDIDLLTLLHPTPAVGGFPRDGALQSIEELEPFDRGWYAGPVGWMSNNSAEFAVAIRSGLVNEKSVRVFAGAGLIEGSEAQLEWDEIETKISAFMSALGIEKNLYAYK